MGARSGAKLWRRRARHAQHAGGQPARATADAGGAARAPRALEWEHLQHGGKPNTPRTARRRVLRDAIRYPFLPYVAHPCSPYLRMSFLFLCHQSSAIRSRMGRGRQPRAQRVGRGGGVVGVVWRNRGRRWACGALIRVPHSQNSTRSTRTRVSPTPPHPTLLHPIAP